jgi:hypothetical protein
MDSSRRRSVSRRRTQRGGASSSAQLLAQTAKWRSEVAAQRAKGLSFRDALSAASSARKRANPSYKTTKEASKVKHPYGHKNKNPVSLASAQKILLNYYRTKKDGSIRGLRKAIGSCKSDKKVLTPGAPNSYLYRRNGPRDYDMMGLTNFCGKAYKTERKSLPIYRRTSLDKKVKGVRRAPVKSASTKKKRTSTKKRRTIPKVLSQQASEKLYQTLTNRVANKGASEKLYQTLTKRVSKKKKSASSKKRAPRRNPGAFMFANQQRQMAQ